MMKIASDRYYYARLISKDGRGGSSEEMIAWQSSIGRRWWTTGAGRRVLRVRPQAKRQILEGQAHVVDPNAMAAALERFFKE